MTASDIPLTFEEWKHCITKRCGLDLSHTFVKQRILALENTNDPQTKVFINLYGEAHYQNTLSWFKMAVQFNN